MGTNDVSANAGTATAGSAPDVAAVIELFAGSYGLILEELDETELNARMRRVSGADGVLLTRWLKDDPQHRVDSRAGSEITLPACFSAWLDSYLHNQDPDLPLLLEPPGDRECALHRDTIDFVRDPHNLCLLLDTQPSRLLYILQRDTTGAPWSQGERQLLLAIAEVNRQSVRLHKQVDRLKKIVATSNQIFNSSPRGMVMLLPDGQLRIANAMATRICRDEDVIDIANEKVRIADRTLQRELENVLAAAAAMPIEEAHTFSWHRSLPRPDKKQPLHLAARILPQEGWRIESLPSDKMVILFVNDPLRLQEPSTEQLSEYYGLTAAQASVALALWGGVGITEAAATLSISINTARTHLRAIYEKVGVRSHAELMSVLTAMASQHGDSGSAMDFLLPQTENSYNEP